MADAKPAGLLAALRNIGATLLGSVQTRLALLGNELEAQKIQLLQSLLLAQAMLVCAVIGVLLSVSLLAILLWEQRLMVFGVAAAVFLLAAALCYRALMRNIKASGSPFEATLAELQEDMRQLKAATHHAKAPD